MFIAPSPLSIPESYVAVQLYTEAQIGTTGISYWTMSPVGHSRTRKYQNSAGCFIALSERLVMALSGRKLFGRRQLKSDAFSHSVAHVPASALTS